MDKEILNIYNDYKNRIEDLWRLLWTRNKNKKKTRTRSRNEQTNILGW